MDHEAMARDFKRRFFVSVILTVPVLIFSPLLQNLLGFGPYVPQLAGNMEGYIQLIFSTAIFFYGGKPFLTGLLDELKEKRPGMMTLIGLAITVAYGYSALVVLGLAGKVFFWELATLIDVMLLGHYVEMKSVQSASRSLEELAKLMPSNAHLLQEDGSIEDVSIKELSAGDWVLVKPGEKIPADGHILEGESSIDESMVTGESRPVSKSQKEEVIGGSVNGEASLTIKVKATGEDSFLSQVVDLVKEAQQGKTRTQNLADKAAMYLTFIAITAGLITFLAWNFFLRETFVFSLERTVTVMVITCPHALGLAIPLVVAVSTSIAAVNGLLIRDRASFEKSRDIDAILFDKTGTLTKGEFGVTDVIPASDYSKEEILYYAASVESHSEHPIARGITSSAERYSRKVKDFSAIPGKGAKAQIDGSEIKVVSRNYLEEKNISHDIDFQEKVEEEGKTIVFLLIEDELAGAIALADQIREESKKAISQLKEMGIKCMMLTGDDEKVASWVAKELDLEEYFSEVLPQDKSDKVKEIQSRDLTVAMTGDGVNDAPALAQADVGIAVGAGTDVAAETADIILVKSNPLDIVSVIVLSKATYRKMLENLFWATGYNAIAIPLAAGILYPVGVLLNPAAGAILMSLSTVIVAINARLLSI